MTRSTLAILVIGAVLCIIMLPVLSSLLPTCIPAAKQWVADNALAVSAERLRETIQGQESALPSRR